MALRPIRVNIFVCFIFSVFLFILVALGINIIYFLSCHSLSSFLVLHFLPPLFLFYIFYFSSCVLLFFFSYVIFSSLLLPLFIFATVFSHNIYFVSSSLFGLFYFSSLLLFISIRFNYFLFTHSFLPLFVPF